MNYASLGFQKVQIPHTSIVTIVLASYNDIECSALR